MALVVLAKEVGQYKKCLLYISVVLLLYRTAGNFRGVQFSQKGNLQRFRGLIFADGRSRTAPPTIPG